MLNTVELTADVCVVGGGMSGLAAAISAARAGAKVVLMHERPVLGGNASSEIRMWICGADGENNRETGLAEEIALTSLYRNPTKNFYVWDTILFDFAKSEPNLTLLLNCTCMDAETETGAYPYGRSVQIHSVTGYSMTTQQFYKVKAHAFLDCSGDSILAPLTGAEYAMGREGADVYGEDTHVKTSDNMTMGMSCLIQARETTGPVPYKAPSFAMKLTDEHVKNRRPNLRKSSENFWYLELGGDRDTIKDTDAIRDELVALACGMWDYLKNETGEAENFELDFLGFLPGKRESRRLMGEYVLTQKDISENKAFHDVVAYGGWTLDDHFPGGFFHKGAPNTNFQTPAPYQIPYRCLYSKNVSNLLFAGRNISTTHMALSSTRVMATCMLLGQAAGFAAAICSKESIPPHGVYENHLDELQDMLMEADCFLPGLRRKISQICRNAALSGPESLRDGADREHALYNNVGRTPRIANGQAVSYRLPQPAFVQSVRMVFDSDLNRLTLPGTRTEQTHVTRAVTLLDSPVMHMPKTLCKAFVLEGVTPEGETVCLYSDEENCRRAITVPVERQLSGLSLKLLSNWGNTEETPLISFDFR